MLDNHKLLLSQGYLLLYTTKNHNRNYVGWFSQSGSQS